MSPICNVYKENMRIAIHQFIVKDVMRLSNEDNVKR
jgi:hypothetical protein